MFEMKLIREPYNYGDIGHREYGAEVKVNINPDASGDDVIMALVELMRYATFSDTTIINCMEQVLDELKYEKEEEAKATIRKMDIEEVVKIANNK